MKHHVLIAGYRISHRGLLTALLGAVFIWSLFGINGGTPLLHPGGLGHLVRLIAAMVRPNLSPELLAIALEASWRTLAYATAGMSLAVLWSVPAGILASGVLAKGRIGRLLQVTIFRSLLGFLRAIHELVWAWLFVAAIGLSPYAAVWALALPYGGILGRILADILVDVPEAPLRALRAAGAGEMKVLFYGRLPAALADLVSYTFYRYECAIRSATIMSFVGLGGLGYQIQISLADLRYDEVWTFIYCLIVMVLAVDAWSTAVRRRLVA